MGDSRTWRSRMANPPMGPLRRASKGLLARWPCVLLCLIGARQIWLAHTDTLSPWKGGGFGMFAVIDSPGERFLHCTGTTYEEELVIVRLGGSPPLGPGARPDLMDKLRTFPERSDLQTLANAVLEFDFVEIGTSSRSAREQLSRQNPWLLDYLPTLPAYPQRVLVPRDPRREGHRDARLHRLRTIEATLWRKAYDMQEPTMSVTPLVGPVRSRNRTRFEQSTSNAQVGN